MHIEYTPEEVRTLIEEHEALDYLAATTDDVAVATDVLEGVEELIAKLDPDVRYQTVKPYSTIVEDQVWIPVANNCTRSAGIAVDLVGTLSFTVRGEEGGLTTYFAARQAVAHALAGVEAATDPVADCSISEQSPCMGTTDNTVQEDPLGADPLVTLLKENGWAIAAGNTLADIDGEVLAQSYRLSEEGIAHLFSTEDGDGIILAMTGSTAGDRRRATEKLPTLPSRSYSSRSYSVLFDYGETGDHYSEQEGFGQTIKEAPKPKEHLLVDAAERFKASRFVRPSPDKPLDTDAIRRRVRRIALVQAAVRDALAVDSADASELVRRVTVVRLIARYMSRKMVRQALDAEWPWDSKAERGRMVQAGRRIRSEIIAARKARAGEPLTVPTARELDEGRQARKAAAEGSEDPKLHSSIEERRKSGRASYDAARAVYLQRCPELEHKLLHILRRDGVKAEARFLSRHSNLVAEATNPKGTLRAALAQLAASGKVRRVRSHKTGEVFFTATEGLDASGYRRSLNGLIRDERFGITNPWSEASPVEAEGEAGEWEEGTENLDSNEAARLAPKRFSHSGAPEQQLMAAEEVGEYSAFEEIEALAEAIDEEIA